jgi:tetratricopeptide (TPR) repeat protein
MSKLFISYSSKDLRLADDLAERLRRLDFETLLDRTNIYPLDDWQRRIEHLIIEASLVVFIATENSNDSEVCKWELETAARHNKKIAPIAFTQNDLRALPQAIRWINGVLIRADDFDAALLDLARSWRRDSDWLDKHAFLGVRADRWEHAGRSDVYLLRDQELSDAQQWVSNRPWGTVPKMTTTQRDFLYASAKQETISLTARRVLFFVALGVVVLTFIKIVDDPIAHVSANVSIDQGRRLVLKGNDDDAIVLFNKAIQRDPTATKRINGIWAAIYVRRGDSLLNSGDGEGAIALFNEAIKRDQVTGKRIADIYSSKAQNCIDQRDYDGAVGYLNNAIGFDSENAEYYNRRGTAYFARQDYDRALVDLNEAIRREQKGARLAFYLSNRGVTYSAKGDYSRALDDVDQALQLNPQSGYAYNMRGRVFTDRKEYGRAISDFDRVIAIVPTSEIGYSNRGYAFYASKDYERAIRDIDQAISLDPNMPSSYRLRGMIYFAQGDSNKAIEEFNQAIQIDAKYGFAYMSRGDVFRIKRADDLARADYELAIQLEPSAPGPVTRRGQINFDEGKYQAAIADFSHALVHQPNALELVLWLYIAEARSGIEIANQELGANAARARSTAWPYPIVEMLLGRRDEEAAIEAAPYPDEHCEAQFFAAELLLLRADGRGKAMDYLRSAADTCPGTSMTLPSVWAELNRLRQ